MKKYIKPAADVEKFTVADVITASTGDVTIDTDLGDFTGGSAEAVAPSAGDEF